MSRRFFTSDTHYWHSNIVYKLQRKHDFVSMEEMHDHMISQWNKHVRGRDIVYVIGDFSFGTKDETKSILDRLNGRKVLVRGNHDRKSQRHLTIKDYLDVGFDDVCDEEVLGLSNGTKVLLKHYPYEKSKIELFVRKILGQLGPWKTYHAFYPIDKGLWHIHGHLHRRPRISGRQINVNVESWDYRPVSEAEICKMIDMAERKKFRNRLRYFKNGVIGKLRSFCEKA